MSRKPDSPIKETIRNKTCLSSGHNTGSPRNLVYDSSLEKNHESSFTSEKLQQTLKDVDDKLKSKEVTIASEAKEEYVSKDADDKLMSKEAAITSEAKEEYVSKDADDKLTSKEVTIASEAKEEYASKDADDKLTSKEVTIASEAKEEYASKDADDKLTSKEAAIDSEAKEEYVSKDADDKLTSKEVAIASEAKEEYASKDADDKLTSKEVAIASEAKEEYVSKDADDKLTSKEVTIASEAKEEYVSKVADDKLMSKEDTIASEIQEAYVSPVRHPSFRTIDISYVPESPTDNQPSEQYDMLNSPTKQHNVSNVVADITCPFKEISFNFSEEVFLDMESILSNSYISQHSLSSEEITLDIEPISPYTKLPRQSTIVNIAIESSVIDIKEVPFQQNDGSISSSMEMSVGSLASNIVHSPSCEELCVSHANNESNKFLSHSDRSDIIHISFPYVGESEINSQEKGDEDEVAASLEKEDSALQVAVKTGPLYSDNRPQGREMLYSINNSSSNKCDWIFILILAAMAISIIATGVYIKRQPTQYEIKFIKGDLPSPSLGFNEAKQVWSVWKMTKLAFCFAEEKIHPLGGTLNQTVTPLTNFTEVINETGNNMNAETEEEHEKFIECITDLFEKEDSGNQAHIADYRRLVQCIERNFGRDALLDMTGEAGDSCAQNIP